MGKKEETKGMEGGNRMNNKVVKYHICPGCGHPREPCIGEKMKKLFLLFYPNSPFNFFLKTLI